MEYHNYQRPISNYLRKTWPHKVTITVTASHVRNRTGCELPHSCFWTYNSYHEPNSTEAQRRFPQEGCP